MRALLKGKMAKDPAVLFYTSDFLSGTSFFSMEQRGQYITLLCEQHQLYSIPEDHIIKICGSLDNPVAKKFTKDKDETYFQYRMREESEKRKSFCESRRQSVSARYVRKPHVKHTKVRMEDENEDRNKDKNTIEIPLHLKEIWPSFLEMRKSLRKPATAKAQEILIKKLYTLSPLADIQIKIVEQSIASSWQSFFELKSDSKPRYGRQEVDPAVLKAQAARFMEAHNGSK